MHWTLLMKLSSVVLCYDILNDIRPKNFKLILDPLLFSLAYLGQAKKSFEVRKIVAIKVAQPMVETSTYKEAEVSTSHRGE